MNRELVIELLSAHAKAYQMTGSRYICNPPPYNTDEDYIALSDDGELSCALGRHGFEMNTDPEKYDELPDFLAWRCGEYNIIETYDGDFYKRFVDATDQARALNLIDKSDRIALFQRVLYGNELVDRK